MSDSEYIIDAYSWIEYIKGNYNGVSEFKSIIELGKIHIPTLVVAEIKRAYVRDNIPNFNEDFNQIKSIGNLLESLEESVAIRAGEFRSKLGKITKNKAKKPIGLIDCFLLSIAIKINAKVLSGDEHFKLIANPDEYGIPSELQYLKDYAEYIKEEEN